jgi:hypothetical protein
MTKRMTKRASGVTGGGGSRITCRTHGRLREAIVAGMFCIVVGVGAQEQAHDAEETATRVGRYVEAYYSRAQSIVVDESVVLQPLTSGFSFEGFARRLKYEVRVEWNPAAGPDEEPATVVRHLISATGPTLGTPSQPDCLDPGAVSPEPLAFLLPDRQHRLVFKTAGTARVGDRPAVRLDYRPVEVEPAEVDWEDDCGRISLPGRTRGRIWADAATAEILRFDEHLVGMVDIPGPPGRRAAMAARSFTIERADTSIRYSPVRFENPDEILLLPEQIESVTIIRNSGVPRLRTTRSFSNYRRFVTDTRIVE